MREKERELLRKEELTVPYTAVEEAEAWRSNVEVACHPAASHD